VSNHIISAVGQLCVYTLHSIDWQVRRLVAVSTHIIRAVSHLCVLYTTLYRLAGTEAGSCE